MQTLTFLFITWDPKPYLLDLGQIKIHYYSLCWIMAFIIGWYSMSFIFKKENEDKKVLDPMFLYIFLGAILGARLGEYIFYNTSAIWETPVEVFLPVRANPEKDTLFGLLKGYEFVGFSGLSSHGATLGILITSILFNRKYLKRNLLWLLDRLSMCVPLGGAFVRLGNFINSEIVGKPSDLPWAVKFVNQSEGYGPIVPRHPAQLYEALGYVLLFFLMWFLYLKTEKKKQLGFLFGIFFICLWVIRFVIEFFKENQGEEDVAQWLNIGLNNGQVLSIPFIILGVILVITSKNRLYIKK